MEKETDKTVCTSFKDVFVFDHYRKCGGEFKLRNLYKYIYYCIVQPSYCTIVFFRIQQYLFIKGKKYKSRNKILFRLFDVLEKIIARFNFTLNSGFEANHNAKVQAGLFVHHPQGIIIGGNTKIGLNCHLFKNVLFGEKNGLYPIIKNNVVLYANCVIIGGITVYDNAVVAPNSVVIDDVDDSQIVAGIPAKPIGTNEYIFIQKEGIPIREKRSGY